MDERIVSLDNPLEGGVPARPEEAENPLVSFIVKKFREWESSRSEMESNWRTWYRTWRCVADEADKTRESEKSQIKIPATKEAINNAVDSIYQIEFSANPFFKLEPQPIDSFNLPPLIAVMMADKKAHTTKIMNQYMRYLFQQENFKAKMHGAITEMCYLGTMVVRVKPEPKVLTSVVRSVAPPQPMIDPQTGMQIGMGEPVESTQRVEKTINRPTTDHIPLNNFYVDPYATGTQAHEGCEGVIVRSITKNFELKRMKKAGSITDLPDNLGAAPTNDEKEYRLQTSGVTATPDSTDVELFEWWGWIDGEILKQIGFEFDETMGGAEITAIVANRKHLLKAVPNPFNHNERPFMKDCYEEVPGEFYGIGICEIASGPQRALDATVRARIDNLALSLNNVFGINVDKMIPGQNLTMKPGKAFLFHGPPQDSLYPMVIPDVTQSTYPAAQEYSRYIQAAHGIAPIVGGMPSKRGEQTATEVSMMMSQSNTRIKMLVESFENNIMIPLLKWYARIVTQYLNDSEIFLLTDSQTGAVALSQITTADVADDFEFIPMGAISINARQEFQKRMNVLQMVSNPVLAQFANIPYMLKKAYEALNLDDTDVAILSQVPPQQVQQLMMQGMQGGAPTPPGVEQGGSPMGVTNGPDQPGQMIEPPNAFGGLPQ